MSISSKSSGSPCLELSLSFKDFIHDLGLGAKPWKEEGMKSLGYEKRRRARLAQAIHQQEERSWSVHEEQRLL